MKNLTILFLLALGMFSTSAFGQYVTIPDTAFVAFLQANYPGCMNGNQMDTTCSDIITARTVDCSGRGISDLTGIRYFDVLLTLKVKRNNLTTLEDLPNSVGTLYCDSNQINTIVNYPANLSTFSGEYNQLTSMPAFPQYLQRLYVSHNLLSTIPALPQNFMYLFISYNPLDSLPQLPNSLLTLTCYNSNLTSLPPMPPNVNTLHCSGNQLTALPALNDSLKDLDCSNNPIAVLPTWPPTIWHLSLQGLSISSIPALPNTVTFLLCSDNQLDSLPILPPNLSSLQCVESGLSWLPELPKTIHFLTARGNNLTEVPELPPVLDYLELSQNPINCLPELTTINSFSFYGTNITCLPNYGNVGTSNPPLSTLPLCNLYNTHGCRSFNNINGRAYFDTDTNCTFNAADVKLGTVKVQLYDGSQLLQESFTGGEGYYSFDVVNVPGTYLTLVDTSLLPFTVACPDSAYFSSVITATDTFFSGEDFGMKCRQGHDVGAFDIVKDQSVFRPASTHTFSVIAGDAAKLYGTTCATISGQVQVIMSGPASVVAFPGSTPSTVNGDTITFTVNDFSMSSLNSDFLLNVQVDTTAQAGDQVCFDVTVEPLAGDFNPANNHYYTCFEIVNSHDPNNKEVYPLSYLDTTQKWLHYTVNFQNTGNAPAQHVYILDTLSSNLDWGSMQLLSYSHDNYTQVLPGGIIKFNFPNINLPDSTTDEPGSHGFIRYKVKLKDNLPAGTTIENTAYIYFDFNSPVVTNTTLNTLLAPFAQPHITSSTSFEACDGDTLTLQTTYNATYTYTWLRNGSSIANSNNASLAVTQSGDYSVSITNDTLTSVSDVQTVAFHPLPSVSINLPTDSFCADAQPVDITTYGSPAGGTFAGSVVTGSGIDISTPGNYPLSYSYTDGNGCSDTKQVNITVEICEGIPDLLIGDMAIYPNPNNGSFTLSIQVSANTELNLKISNALGEVLNEANLQLSAGVNSIPVNEKLSSGVYFIQLTINGQRQIRKLMVY